jgi:hypothetical protein
VYVNQVLVDSFYDRLDSSKIAEYKFRVVWKNSGKTPARNVRASINHLTVSGKLPNRFDFPDRPGVRNRTLPIGPEQETESYHFISIAELVGSYEWESNPHLWAWIEYNDFENKRWRTEYHVTIRATNNPALDNARFYFEHEDLFMGSDEDCFRKPDQKMVA